MDQNTQGGYLSRSWALLTRDRGWIKPVLVLASAQLVPIVGALGATGYALEWARLTAWGVDSAPKQRRVRVGACIASGWRGFVATLGYALAFAVVSALLAGLLGDSSLRWLLSLALSLALSVVGGVVALRATIYQRIGAGYQLRRVWELLRADARGLLRIAGMALALSLASGLVVGIVSVLLMVPLLSRLAASAWEYGLISGYGASSRAVARWLGSALLGSMGSIVVAAVAILFLTSLIMVLYKLLTTTATGLWMRQFDVPAWGESDEPLPAAGDVAGGGYARPAAGGWDAPASGTAGGGFGEADFPGAPGPAATASGAGFAQTGGYEAVGGSGTAPAVAGTGLPRGEGGATAGWGGAAAGTAVPPDATGAEMGADAAWAGTAGAPAGRADSAAAGMAVPGTGSGAARPEAEGAADSAAGGAAVPAKTMPMPGAEKAWSGTADAAAGALGDTTAAGPATLPDAPGAATGADAAWVGSTGAPAGGADTMAASPAVPGEPAPFSAPASTPGAEEAWPAAADAAAGTIAPAEVPDATGTPTGGDARPGTAAPSPATAPAAQRGDANERLTIGAASGTTRTDRTATPVQAADGQGQDAAPTAIPAAAPMTSVSRAGASGTTADSDDRRAPVVPTSDGDAPADVVERLVGSGAAPALATSAPASDPAPDAPGERDETDADVSAPSDAGPAPTGVAGSTTPESLEADSPTAAATEDAPAQAAGTGDPDDAIRAAAGAEAAPAPESPDASAPTIAAAEDGAREAQAQVPGFVPAPLTPVDPDEADRAE